LRKRSNPSEVRRFPRDQLHLFRNIWISCCVNANLLTLCPYS
jgi:hypothetical protein